MSSNCYGYALCIEYIITPGTNGGVNSLVENWDNLHGITAQRVRELIAECKKDGLEEIPVSNKKIAVFINEYATGLDYHFYRLDPGGWSHKLGNTGIPTGVSDPRKANRDLVGKADPNGDIIINQVFCGYLYLPKVFYWTMDEDDHEPIFPHSLWDFSA